MQVQFPAEYEKRMRAQLGQEYEDYVCCFKDPSLGGMRVNTLKLSADLFAQISPYPLTRIPWIKNGYFYPEGLSPAKHPFYYAGLYYLQEPSAMTPASLLPVSPGDFVLDLCAAPGGKSTELAAKLCGSGILVANDISNSRAKALLKNIELFGVKNAVVVSEAPGKLSERFGGFFDKILVDAPCSGEGMFRKSPAIMKNWEQYGTGYYSALQKQILPEAIKMLKPGGKLLYSTCTFSPEEDEGMAAYILDHFPEMELLDALPKENTADISYNGILPGKPEWGVQDGAPRDELKRTVRLWPHKIRGEGHFIALFGKKAEDTYGAESPGSAKILGETRFSREAGVLKLSDGRMLSSESREFLKKVSMPLDRGRIIGREGRLYLLPEGLPDLSGLRVLRHGLLLGEEKKGRFEPSQALAMALKRGEYPETYSMHQDDPDLVRYLKCETLEPKEPLADGYVLVCVGDYPLGWAKLSGGRMKNKYLPGWRMQ